MTALARSLRTAAGLRDMRRDWRGWSAAERCSAVTIMTMLAALLAAALIAGNPI
jgi:hypothetical protein